MTSHGEEASIVGSAAALGPNDEVLGQYREMGVLVWRGCSIDELMAQCLSTERDAGKGARCQFTSGLLDSISTPYQAPWQRSYPRLQESHMLLSAIRPGEG